MHKEIILNSSITGFIQRQLKLTGRIVALLFFDTILENQQIRLKIRPPILLPNKEATLVEAAKHSQQQQSQTMKLIPTTLIVTLTILTSCKNSNQYSWSKLPDVTKISTLRQTEFVPTLESPISKSKNIVYAAAFLYAWNEVDQKLKVPIVLSDSSSNEFKLLNLSTSYKNSLTKNEYSTDAEIVDGTVIAKAFFNKTLPFPSKLQKLDNPILFEGTKVMAIGMQSYDKEIAMFTEVLSYTDDDHFILKFTPQDNQHEILLVKGITEITNLSGAIRKTNDLIEAGKNDTSYPRLSWKHSLNDIDFISIPTIQFNIEKDYNEIEGQFFVTAHNKYHVERAYQQIGFVLSENGAVVESRAEIAVADTIEQVQIKPKKMVFDKPFLVIIKRVQSANPYFVMYVQNSELLAKQ